MATVAPEVRTPVLRDSDSAGNAQEAWTSSGLVSGTSATIIAPREGPEPSKESIEEAYIPVEYARAHMETMQQCMKTMQLQTASHINEIEVQYASIEEDTDSRFNELIGEMKKRGGLMKNHYRTQLGEVHDQLDSTRKAAETVEEKNLELVVTNVDLLRSVNALQQVQMIQAEELEKMSIKYEETMVEQAKDMGKSALEVKKIREEATKERISQRMKYGARITAVLSEAEAEKTGLVNTHDAIYTQEKEKAESLEKELTELKELEAGEKQELEDMKAEMAALQAAAEAKAEAEGAEAEARAAGELQAAELRSSSDAEVAQLRAQLTKLEAELAEAVATTAASAATAVKLQEDLDWERAGNESKVDYVAGPKPSEQIKKLESERVEERVVEKEVAVPVEMPEEMDVAAVAAEPADEDDNEEILRRKLKDSVGRNLQLQIQLKKLQSVLRAKQDEVLENEAKVAEATGELNSAPPAAEEEAAAEEGATGEDSDSPKEDDSFFKHGEKIMEYKYTKAQDQIEEMQEQANESYAELQSLADQLQEAEKRIEELEIEVEDAKPAPVAVDNLSELVDQEADADEEEDDEDTSAAAELDKSVTLQFQILQDQLEREKAARQRADDASEEAKLASEEARDKEATWHLQVKETAEEIATTRVRCTDLEDELALMMKARDDALADAGSEKANNTEMEAVKKQLETLQEHTGEGDETVSKLEGIIKSMQDEKETRMAEISASREQLMTTHQQELDALKEQSRQSLEKEKSVLMAAAETEVESLKAAAEEPAAPEDTRDYSQELAELQQVLDSTVEKLTTQLGDKDAELAGVLAERDASTGATDEEASRKEAEWSTKLEEASSRHQTQLDEQKQLLEEKDDALKRLTDSMSALDDKARQQASVDELQAELVRQGAELDDAQIKLGGALRDANNLETRTDQLEQELEDLQKVLEGKIKELDYKKVALTAAQASLKKATSTKARSGDAAKAKQEAANKRAMEKAARSRELELRRLNKETATLRSKVRTLERSGGGAGGRGAARGGGGGGGGDTVALQKTVTDQRRQMRKLEQDLSKLQQKGGQAALDAQARKLETSHRRELDKMKKEFEKKAKTGAGAKNERAHAKTVKDLETANTELTELRKLPKQIAAQEKRIKEFATIEATLEETTAELTEAQANVATLTKEKAELETMYRNEALLRKQLHNQIEDMKGKIRVYCRCRPMKKNEIDLGSNVCVTFPDQYTVSVYNQNKNQTKTWQFDACFPPAVGQEAVFEETEMLIQSAIDGFNVAVFAYGQTGSGKTFTMCGPPDMPGLAPRSMAHLFQILEQQKGAFEASITSYMLEIYMDELIDLYLPKKTKNRPKMSIMQGEKGIVEVKNCTNVPVESLEHLAKLFEDGQKNRHVTKTKMNDESSRSHLVFAICLKVKNLTSGKVSRGKLSLIDLAGSERLSKTGATGQAAKEGAAINMSLSALGNVIAALSSNEKIIPYRGSALTELMRDSLGGNAKTLMFVNISPADYNCDETLQALLYAARVKMITNDANAAAESAELDELKAQIRKLKKMVPAGVDASAALNEMAAAGEE